MEVSVRLFAGLRELAGSDSLQLELADGASVADALAALSGQIDASGCLLAVNRQYADDDLILAAGDELALIPPVSGGGAQAHVALSDSPLSLDALLERVRDPRAGAVVSFSGVTRDVDALDYEVYAEMALEQMARIVDQAIERHGLCAAANGEWPDPRSFVFGIHFVYRSQGLDQRLTGVEPSKVLKEILA